MIIDRIEISGRVFTGPKPGNYINADFDRKSENISFSLIKPIEVPNFFIDGINNNFIAHIAASIAGPGFYGIETYRLNPNKRD